MYCELNSNILYSSYDLRIFLARTLMINKEFLRLLLNFMLIEVC